MNKKLLLGSVFSVALLFGAGVVNAQGVSVPLGVEVKTADAGYKDFKGKHGFDKLEDKLNLTDTQKEQAKKIHEDGKKKIEPLMDEMKSLREKMDAVRKKNMEEFEKILTPEQKTQLDEMKAKMDARKKEFEGRPWDMKDKHHQGHGMKAPHGDGMLPPPPHGDVPPAPVAE